MQNNYKSRPLSFNSFSRSSVDIIIPFHAQYEKVLNLIKSIILSVKSNPYRVVLIDDCSENKEFHKEINKEFLKTTPQGAIPQVTCIRSESNLGFGGALKLGFDSTNSPWVMFMHSDCLVEDPNFMIKMGRSLLNWKREGVPVKIISARSDNPGDCIDAKWNGKENKDLVLKESVMPMFCCMCNRDLFSYIGGFIKPYPFAWYEDEELAYRMKKHGLLQGVCGNSWIKHYGSSTIKYMWKMKPESKKIMEENREKCLNDMKMLQEKNIT